MRVHSHERSTSDRGIAAAAVIVFVGLFLLMAVVAGVFFVITSGGTDGGDPSKVEISPSRCGVTTQNGTTGVGSVTVSVTYRGNDTVDLSDATLRYINDGTTHEFDIGPNQSTDTLQVRNESGTYDPVLGAQETYSMTIPVAAERGAPLPSASRVKVELVFDSVSTGGATFRTPGAIGPDSSYVDC